METQVRTPQMVFMQPQRLVVPLFQRPYVWNREEQWEPLWNDVTRIAERMLERPGDGRLNHFLGAVVLQQIPGLTGLMQERVIIDGQQRLTTLQLLLDALHAELLLLGQTAPALRIEQLVSNPEPFRQHAEDRFKVWPTNRDRPAFNAVMGLEPPIDYSKLPQDGARMVDAHQFFSTQARQWLTPEAAGLEQRAAALETTLRDLLQLVVIDLGQDENAQAIFETLNARGTPLTAADLVKNFVFQRLAESNAPVHEAYESHWKEFETGFWETEVHVGRQRYPRSSVFLNHWLVARTSKEVVAREVFSRFKAYAEFDSGLSMRDLLPEIHASARIYRDYIRRAEDSTQAIDRLGLFGYRTGALESDVVKPLILWLFDPRQAEIDRDEISRVLDSVESWMVRRMLIRGTTKGYNRFFADLLQHLRSVDRQEVGSATASFLASQRSDSQYWPDDQEVRTELRDLQAYRRLQRGRLRMVLEAVEDHKRGWIVGSSTLGTERVTRGKYVIEHVMPRRWQTHWPIGDQQEHVREQIVHTLGNLTLLTRPLNSRVSNGPWLGPKGKKEGLEGHDVLFLNRELVREQSWGEIAIRSRTESLISTVLEIWPVPAGHKSQFGARRVPAVGSLDLSDLVNAGAVSPGMALFPRVEKHASRLATVLSDGRIEVDGQLFDSPSRAALAITGKPTNGWWFFLVERAPRRTLRDVYREYVATLSGHVEQDEGDEEED